LYSFERFTERAKKVLTLAKQEAERSHQSYIGTEHLLLGLLREGDGLAAKVLNNLGVAINKVRATIESVLGNNERIIIQQIIPTSRVTSWAHLLQEAARLLGRSREAFLTPEEIAALDGASSLERVIL
jgi:ATP-dependent Clp protease ATP-binding subunit ClpC